MELIKIDKYILAIDQSTSGTKALIFDEEAKILGRSDLPHEQIISADGKVSHDPIEIYNNTIKTAIAVIEKTGIDKNEIAGIGISNQRETALVWNRETGEPIDNAVVWHCARAEDICRKLTDSSELVRSKTGLNLSPYFSAAKIAWLLENGEKRKGIPKEKLCAGTMDSWLLYQLTKGESFKTDFSNASRTQLFNVFELKWDEEICRLFGVDPSMLPEVCDSNSLFGMTNLDGYLENAVPIYAMLGDSHGALFGQGCVERGMIKATYGTGSSVMMNIGEKPMTSQNGLVTSLAWGIDGKVNYVIEGNINYTGSVIKWIADDLKLIQSSKEARELAQQANPEDTTYLVPAFTGLGAPYWQSGTKAMIAGMSRSTGRAEIVRAAEECIAYQIADVLGAIEIDTQIEIKELRVDGGPTRDRFLMQFQSNILDKSVSVPESEELSAMGAAFMAGIAAGVYDDQISSALKRNSYSSNMEAETRSRKYSGWKNVVEQLLGSA